MRVLLTVGFTVVQFTAVQQPFIAVDIVPIPAAGVISKRSFGTTNRRIPADNQNDLEVD